MNDYHSANQEGEETHMRDMDKRLTKFIQDKDTVMPYDLQKRPTGYDQGVFLFSGLIFRPEPADVSWVWERLLLPGWNQVDVEDDSG